MRDNESPHVSAPPNITLEAAGPSGTAVTDAILGTPTATDNVSVAEVVRSGVPGANLFPLGTTAIYTVRDQAGNTASALQFVTIVDTIAPSITIRTPEPRTYPLGATVLADYECADTTLVSCNGSVADGASVNTSVVGDKIFTVVASDASGNSFARTVTYQVGYRVCLLYDAARAARSGSTLPIKIQLCSNSGANESDASRPVTIVNVRRIGDATSGELLDAPSANPDWDFRYDPTLGGTGGYILNLSTKGLVTGTYVIDVAVEGDPTLHNGEVIFQVR